jgi:hypothetical protein
MFAIGLRQFLDSIVRIEFVDARGGRTRLQRGGIPATPN